MPDAAAPARIARPDGWQILKRNRAAVIALGFLVGLSIIAIVVPMLLPESLKVTSSASFVPPMQRAAENSALHVLGTDVNGQDMLYRILAGARVSLGVGLVGALISLVITRIAATPFRKLFSAMDKGSTEVESVIDREAIVTSAQVDERYGQVAITTGAAPLLVNARTSPGDPPLIKGTAVRIHSAGADHAFYFVEPNPSITPTTSHP